MDLSQPAAHSGPQIRYIIIKSRTPRLIKQNWRLGSLEGKTFDNLCGELALLIRRPHIQRIDFELWSEMIEYNDSVDREHPADFDTMREDFREEMMGDMEENGTMRFEIRLEPDGGLQNELEPETPTNSKREDMKPFNF